VARGVPIPAITAALFARFSSQDPDSVAMKAIASLRDQFGGHGVVPEDAPGEGPAPTATRDEGSV
jgi:6-phosphogluconate dehydrogenase